ncbi:MAG TPA: hypothetical protein VI408_11260 [Gaiellaceae bacterium]
MRRFTLLAALACVVAAVVAAPSVSAAPAAATTSPISTPITGTTPTGGTLNGILNITGFANQGGQLVANGTLVGTITDAVGNIVGTVNQAVTLPVGAASTGSCTILHLVLGPINLNLLGLQVTTNQIVLDISAVPGAGNLLGNLLCSVAHLLDNSGSPAGGLSALLNNILGILSRL